MIDDLFSWDKAKNEKLIKERGVSFEDIVSCIAEGRVLDLIVHPNLARYKNQMMWIVEKDNYAYLVPFVMDGDRLFLKTVIPSRKDTKKYLGRAT